MSIRAREITPNCRVGVLTLLIITAFFAGAGQAAGALPATPLALLDGGTLDFQTLKGKVVVLRFLASW